MAASERTGWHEAKRIAGRGRAAPWRAAALAVLLTTTSAPAQPAGRRDPAPPPSGPINVSMRNVVLYPYDDVPATVLALSGTVVPDRPPKPVTMDDVSSYRIETQYAEIRLSAEDMTRLMNRHILPSAHTAIREVNVGFGDGAITMSGTMVKLGVPVPFTATATLMPTASGELRVHVTAMRSAGVIPKGLTDALGLQVSTLAQPKNRQVFRIEGDDMIVPLVSMFPPPRFGGRLAAIRVTPSGLEATIGRTAPLPPPPVEASSFIHFRGGTVNFARLTMHDTDMVMLPEKGENRMLAFSPGRYYAQLEGGYTKSLPNRGLAAYVKDYRAIARATPTPP